MSLAGGIQNIPKYALCVGGTSGIGAAIAKNFAKNNINVIILGRNEISANKIINEMKIINPINKFEFLHCDCYLLKNVKNNCNIIKNKLPYINYCVFTQSLVSFNNRNESIEKIDNKMCLHYYSRIQFIEELLPLFRNAVKNNNNSKIMSILSAGEHQPYLLKNDLSLINNYTLSDVANACGFYTDLIFDYYNNDIINNKGISWLHVHPGNVKTNWGNNLSVLERFVAKIIQLNAISADKCANNLSKIFYNETISKGGFYLIGKHGKLVSKTESHSSEWSNEIYKHTKGILDSIK